MTAKDILRRALEVGVTLVANGGKVRCGGQQEAVDELLPDIRAHKPELLRLLTDRPPCSGCQSLRMAEVPVPGHVPPYRFVWGCEKGHLRHGYTTPDLRLLVAPDSCLVNEDHNPAFKKERV